MPRMLTVACLQTRPKPSFETALAEALTLAHQAVEQGAQLLALPEYCGGLATMGAAFAPPAAFEQDHPFLAGMREFAEKNGVDVLIGSIAVKIPGSSDADKFVNRSYYIDKFGEILSRYDKIHLFDVNISPTEIYRESDRVTPGDAAVITQSRFGAIGHSICYDLRFGQLYRDLAQNGAEILAIPAAFAVPTGQAHWHVLNRARAIENGTFVIAPCAHGPVTGGGASYGHSLIIDPWGEILADGGDGAGVITTQIDLDLVAKTRARVPSLTHDRSYSHTLPAQKDVA